MRYDLNASYVLMNDLDSSSFEYDEFGNNWTVVGLETTEYTESLHFRGIFDGQGHTISDLIITTCPTSQCGLFGESNGTIMNVGMINTTNLGGGDSAGSLLAYNYGTVKNCYSIGDMEGGFATGGLVGYNDNYYLYGEGVMIDCYSFGNVNGLDNAGGLVGYNNGNITDSLAIGTVDGTVVIGGLVGYDEGTVVESFYDLNVSGLNDSDRGTPKTTEELQNISTYENWNISYVSSNANFNSGYPFLAWQNDTFSFAWLIPDFRISQEEIPQEHANDVIFNTMVSSGAGIGRFVQTISIPLMIFLIIMVMIGIIIFVGYNLARNVKNDFKSFRK
jgi:hypothetical protein